MNRAERRETARTISDTHHVPFRTAFAAVRAGVHPRAIALALEHEDLIARRRAFIAAVNAMTRRRKS